MKRVAVIGSGIAGLGAARALASSTRVTLFEAADRFGGHSHTVDVSLDGQSHGVDTGFLVFNDRTYPRLIALFDALGIETAASEMSFSVQSRGDGIEWSGSDLNGVFAQRSNLLRPRFWRLLADIARFNRMATAAVLPPAAAAGDGRSVGDFLDQHRFSAAFRDWYFLPMVACIWSCPTEQMLRFPLATLLRFCHNHGLLQVRDRPQWRTVVGGSRRYVERIVASLGDARRLSPVRGIRRREGGGVDVAGDVGSERFDAVVVAAHSDQALALLDDPSAAERRLLGAVGYHANRAVLHTDTRVLPRRRRAWAAWNYERGEPGRHGGGRDDGSPVCLHYLIDRLQPLPFARPVIVSLNPLAEPDPRTVLGTFDYAHPVFDAAAIAAQAGIGALQGARDTWFCGAWTGYGFHEDGLASGLDAAAGVVARLAAAVAPPRRRETA